MGEKENKTEERSGTVSKSLLFKGPTVIAALVCFVAALFSVAVGAAVFYTPGGVQGTFLINLSNGNPLPQGLLDTVGSAMVGLGVLYGLSALLLWSEVHWIKGVYAGIIVSMVGMVVSGLSTTFAPGIAATGMIVNVLIITLLATETWEATRGMK